MPRSISLCLVNEIRNVEVGDVITDNDSEVWIDSFHKISQFLKHFRFAGERDDLRPNGA